MSFEKSELYATQVSSLRVNYRGERQVRVKKFLDEALALLLLIVLSPLIGSIALVLWVTMGRPVLFRQERSGLSGRPFQIIKFRTMTDKRDSSGRALPDEMRLTAFPSGST